MGRPDDRRDRTQLFVVRLWAEPFDSGRRVLRGEVVNVASDRRVFFARWRDLLAFLSQAVGAGWDGDVDVEIMIEME